MKICKNNLDVIVKPVPKCAQCALRINTRPCLWIKISNLATLDCGGVIVPSLSDIFKL